MAKKVDNFEKIALDLGRYIKVSHNELIKSRKNRVKSLIIVIALVLLFGIGTYIKHHRYSEVKIPQAMKEQYQALNASDYSFVWTSEDFDRLTASDTMKGDHVDDVVTKYGKASSISSYSGSDDLYVNYEDGYWRYVHLIFKRFDDGEYYLSGRYFSGFEVPEGIRPVFKSDGDPITKAVAKKFVDLANTGGDKGEVLAELTSLYIAPDEMRYNRTEVSEDIVMSYNVKDSIDTLELSFSRDGEKAFKLQYAIYSG